MIRYTKKIFLSGLFVAAFIVVVPLYAIGLCMYVFAEWLGATVSGIVQRSKDGAPY